MMKTIKETEGKKNIQVRIISFIAIILAYVLYALLNNSILVSILDRKASWETIIDFFMRGALWGMGAGSVIYLVLIFIYVVFTKNCVSKEK